MHLKIKISMYEQLSKPLKMDGIKIYLLDVACLIFMQNVFAKNVAKWLPIVLVQKFIFGWGNTT